MDFRIVDTLTEGLARLTSDAQKAVKTTAFNLELNPANPSANLLLCCVDHHDKAYFRWVEPHGAA